MQVRFPANLVILALLVLATPVAEANIALFTDGRTLKIEAYRLGDGGIVLTLKSGGSVTVPLTRIERIVDDEVVAPAIVAEATKAIEEKTPPHRSWRYSETSTPIFKTKYDTIIVAAAKKFDVDAALVSAVIKAESDFNTREVSNKGARGLMQLMPATAERFGVTDSFDPVANVNAGTRYLRWLLETFDDNAELALAAYNAGEGNVWKYNGVPPFRETVEYINRIARHMQTAIAAAVPRAIVGAMETVQSQKR